MTHITVNHVEWAVVGRLRLMLEEPSREKFNVTQTYALFTTILCWVVQHIRIPTHEIKSPGDRIAHKLLEIFSDGAIADGPWRINVTPTARIERVGLHSIPVPAPRNFETHTVRRFLINLRDATLHGDARKVSPFNVERLLAGFTFACEEVSDRRRTWEGEITLLEQDMRRIGIQLAKTYCDALRRTEPHRGDNHFGSDAASIRETAA
jgi:hypothetical protein